MKHPENTARTQLTPTELKMTKTASTWNAGVRMKLWDELEDISEVKA